MSGCCYSPARERILLPISSKIAFKGNYEIIYRKDAKGAKGLLIPLWPAMALLDIFSVHLLIFAPLRLKNPNLWVIGCAHGHGLEGTGT
jgi:hypothetical protein